MTDNFGPTVQLPCYEVLQLAQRAQRAIRVKKERRMEAAVKKYKSSRIKLFDFIFGEPTEEQVKKEVMYGWEWYYPSRAVVDVLCNGLLDKAPELLVTVSVDDLRYMADEVDSLDGE